MENYFTIEFADQIIGNNYFVSDSWNSLSLEQKEQIIFTATEEVDNKANWIGKKIDLNQIRQFPRDFTEFLNRNDSFKKNERYINDHGIIPLDIQKGVIELIIFWLRSKHLPSWDIFKEYGAKKFQTPEGLSVEFPDTGRGNKLFVLPSTVTQYIKYYTLEYFPLKFSRGGNKYPEDILEVII